MIRKFNTLLLASLFFVACQSPQNDNAEVNSASTITLSGTIENPIGDNVTLRNREQKLNAEVNQTGVFNLDITIEKAGFWTFGHGGERTSIYLQPEKNLSLTLNSEEFDETLKYEGDGAPENNYLAAKYLLDEELWENRKEIYKMDEVAFVEKTIDIRQQMNGQLEKFSANLSSDFVNQQQYDLLYGWAQNRLNFQSYHRYYAEDEAFTTSESYADYLSELSKEDEEALDVSAYKNFWQSYAYKKAQSKFADDANPSPEDRIINNLETIQSIFTNEKVRNKMLYAVMFDVASYEGSKATENVLNSYKALTSNEEDLTKIKEKLEPWTKLKKGMPAPDFKYATIKGEQVALSDLKGKSVYIDIWATWCGPCRKELPSLEALETKYKDNEYLVFASVSIDENKEAWETMVTEKEMQGIQLFADKAWESKICEDYLIKGIPRFIIVGSDGNLIDADAPRPSSDEIKEILADLAKPGLTSMK